MDNKYKKYVVFCTFFSKFHVKHGAYGKITEPPMYRPFSISLVYAGRKVVRLVD